MPDVPNPNPQAPPLPRPLIPLAALAARVYGAAIDHRNRRFDRGRGVNHFPAPVLSVGNLSVGGTGKTPMVVHIVQRLYELGRHPCVAMRGYGAKAGATPDEADLYRRWFPDLPIVAQPDRSAGLRALFTEPFQPVVDSVVLDDGFQHRRIARGLDLVLIDASRPPARDHLLPRGRLREPISALRRASAVVITHAELVGPDDLLEVTNAVTRAHGRPPAAVVRHAWSALRIGDLSLPLDWLLGRSVVGVCAIGNPLGFRRSLERTLTADPRAPGRLAEFVALPDHDPFRPRTVERLARLLREAGSTTLVCTDKDWSKLRRLSTGSDPRGPLAGVTIARPVLALDFTAGREHLDRLIAGALAAPVAALTRPTTPSR